MFCKIKFFLLTLLFLFLFNPASTFAAENFKSDYTATYTVNLNGTTHVNLDVILTNTSSDFYASSYTVSVGFTDMENIQVTDGSGPFTPEIIKSDNGNLLKIVFRDKALGNGAQQKFDVDFDTNQIASNNGHTWEINIPGINKQNDFSTFNAVVNVPPSLNQPSYIKPKVGTLTGSKLSFSKEELGNAGISIGYGSFQIYEFDLTYHLYNTNIFPVSYEIALPPDTNYQQVFLDSLSPAPKDVYIDKDGNWLAKYDIGPSKRINVIAKGKAKLSLTPKQEYLNSDQIKAYTSGRIFWDTENQQIKDLAVKLKTPEAIYKYVVETLNYDFSRVKESQKRQGAALVVSNPESAVCLEFTDLFIAISRAAGIPAREVNGYANTQNSKERPLSLLKDILHAWPEYYDSQKQAWIMVDPTWGNTTRGIDYFNTLDFDHLAFVVRGYSSTYPVPAGGYKREGDEALKDVLVKVSKVEPEVNSIIRLSDELPSSAIAGIPIKGGVVISNIGNVAKDASELSIETSVYKNKVPVEKIPPFGNSEIALSISNPSFLTNTTDKVRIQFENQALEKPVRILPIFLNKAFILGGIIFVFTITILSIITYRSRHLSIPKQ